MIQEAHIPAAVALLPIEARVTLMLGPISMTAPEDVGDCRVCVALDHWINGGYARRESPAQRRALAAALGLFDWHQGWDLFTAGHISLLGRGPEVYARCCQIYTAAGWRGPETVVLGPHESVRRLACA